MCCPYFVFIYSNSLPSLLIMITKGKLPLVRPEVGFCRDLLNQQVVKICFKSPTTPQMITYFQPNPKIKL